MNTERTIFDINNLRKRKVKHIVLINTRNKKSDNNYRFITEYFNTQNGDESKDLNNKTITKKNLHNNNNSLSIDFNETLTGRLKHFENSTKFISKNNETPNKKKFIKYLKANNLYNQTNFYCINSEFTCYTCYLVYLLYLLTSFSLCIAMLFLVHVFSPGQVLVNVSPNALCCKRVNK